MAGASKRAPAEELDVDGTAVRLSNPDKVYFPRLGARNGISSTITGPSRPVTPRC